MEINHTIFHKIRLRFLAGIIIVLSSATLYGQGLPVKYTIHDGKMLIEVSKNINHNVLDSFMTVYNIIDVPIKEFIIHNSADSLSKLGWSLELNNTRFFIISKPLFAISNIDSPSEKIIFTQKPGNLNFPENIGIIRYGYNRFRNKHSFAVSGPTVTFFLRNKLSANRVMLAGSFSNWQNDAVAMTKTDSGWIANIKLEPGKHWYKFILDGNWDIDHDNLLRENDGRGNVNSVYYKTNFTFNLPGITNARKVFIAGSFNDWRNGELVMNKSGQDWQLNLYLPEGTHTYKYVVDGQWMQDPSNKNQLPDGYKSYNSVVKWGKPYLFQLNGHPNAKQVTIIGSFNNWKANELFMEKTSTGWNLLYTLGPGNHEYKFIVDGKGITDPENPILTSNVKNPGNSFLVIAPNYTFRLKGFNNAKSVFLAGDFNNWNPYSLPLKKEKDEWTTSVNLTPGKHVYKFIVDGKWIIDPGNKLWEQNEHNSENSVLWWEKY